MDDGTHILMKQTLRVQREKCPASLYAGAPLCHPFPDVSKQRLTLKHFPEKCNNVRNGRSS
uniref:Uncharacterized protein n=1 Tax=Romanomermis culicivorax TaxID=13658 RepID=A0A915I650_ROMCU